MRPFLDKAGPSAWKAAQDLVTAVSKTSQAAGLTTAESELIKLRASQINGCAFCLDLHSRQARDAGIPPVMVTEYVLAAMADTVTPQGLVAVARQTPQTVEEIFSAAPMLVTICHEIRDPGNLGTIIRASDAAGADAVILTGRTVDPYNPKVVRSTTGSLFHLPIAVGGDLTDVVGRCRTAGLRVLAADVKGDEFVRARAQGALDGPTGWLFGNEAHGLEDEALELADHVLKLPIYGRAESLNLATAASVCLYESAFAQHSARRD